MANVRSSVVFIDSRVPDLGVLLGALRGDPSVHMLRPDRPGLMQIADHLRGRQDIQSLHILSHGEPGALQLGSGWVGADALAAHRDALAAIRACLSQDADVLLYGCNVAAGDAGRGFVAALARATGVNVASSSGPVGSTELGGNWLLDHRIGTVSSPVVLSRESLGTFRGLLAAVGSVSDTNSTDDQVAENAGPGTMVGITASALDPDPVDTVSYSLTSNPDGLFAIDPTSGVVTTAAAIDRETHGATRTITVTATSSDTSTATADFTIAIGDVDEFDVTVPTDANAAANSVNENVALGTAVGITANASDGDATTHAVSYSLTSNPDGLFAIDPTSGVVTTAAAIDRETHGATRTITVTATSSDTSTATANFTIAIGDVDEFDVTVPTDANAAANTVNENVALGTAVGITANASDGDATTHAVSYSLTSNPDGLFAIDPTSGVVTTAAAIDRETHGATRTITVTATSSDTSTATANFTIAIGDVDEFDVTVPTDANAAANTVNENVALGTAVGITANASDGDATTHAVSYSLTSNPDGLFTIDPTSGVVTTAAAIDRETHGATRTITVTATSSDTSTATADFTIALINQNDAPVLVPTSGPKVEYTENALPIQVNPGLSVTDQDDLQLRKATIFISGGFTEGDTLDLTLPSPGISWNYDSLAGMLTLSGADTLVNYEAALQSVRFFSSSQDPTGLSTDRTLTWTVEDVNATLGSNGVATSLPVTSTIRIAATNDLPVPTPSGTTAKFVEALPGTLVEGVRADPVITLKDDDDTEIQSATITISAGLTAGDRLEFTNTGLIENKGFDPLTGILTLEGKAGVAAYEAALRSVKFINSGDDPTADQKASHREIVWTVKDADSDGAGAKSSKAVTSIIDVVATNDAPTVSAGGVLDYVENGAANFIDPAIVLGDADDSELAAATVTLLGGPVFGDLLQILNKADFSKIVIDYDAGAGVLSLTGVDSRANYEIALRKVTFLSTNDDPTHDPALSQARLTRTIEWTVTDANSDGVGAKTSTPVFSTVNLKAVNDVPVLTAGGSLAYTENEPAQAIDGTITLADLDDIAIASATVRIAGGLTNGDVLGFTGQNGIVGQYDAASGTLTLTGTNPALATLQNFQAALRSATYFSSSDDPTVNQTRLSRTIEWTVTDADSDGAGAKTSTPVFSTVNIAAVNDAPVLTAGGSLAYTENDPALAIDGSITLADRDDTAIAGARVRIADGLNTGDVLGFTDQNGIEGQYDAASGTLTLTGTNPALATLQNFQAALRSVTYFSSNDDPTVNQTRLSRTIEWTVTDADSDGAGAKTSTPVFSTVNIAAVNDAPVLTAAGSLAYTENDPAIAIDTTITLSDIDDTEMDRATVRISSGLTTGDLLEFVTNSLIQNKGYDPVTGTLTLEGRASVSAYQEALKKVQFRTTSEDPTANAAHPSRTLEWIVTDADSDKAGAEPSTPVFSTIKVSAVNDAPVLSVGGSLAYTEDGGPAPIVNMVTLSDLDDTEIDSATVQISAGLTGGDVLALPGGTQGPISSTYHANTGLLSLTGRASVNQYQAALRSITYVNTGDQPGIRADGGQVVPNLSRTITWTVTDADSDKAGAATTPPVQSTITMSPRNDAPLMENSGTFLSLAAIRGTGAANVGGAIADLNLADWAQDDDLATGLSGPFWNAPVTAIAVTAVSGGGSWEYRLNGGSGWLPIDFAAHPGQVLLLDAADSLRFQPQGDADYAGASFAFRAWDQNNGLQPGSKPASGFTDLVAIVAENQLSSQENRAYAASLIEAQSGGVTLTGTAGRDRLVGGAGDDFIDGGRGRDVMLGGAGNDSYRVDNGGDRVREEAGGGNDLVYASVSYRLAAEVENLTLVAGSGNLSGNGNGLANTLTGNEGNNRLYGGGGNDILQGGGGRDSLFGGVGDDTLAGGAGNDKLYGGAGADRFEFREFGDAHADRLFGFAADQGDRIALGFGSRADKSDMSFDADTHVLSYTDAGGSVHAIVTLVGVASFSLDAVDLLG